MHRIFLFVILSITAGAMSSCRQDAVPAASAGPVILQAEVQQKLFYDKLPSASGIEKAGTGYYVIGDDAPYLYLLDADFRLAAKFALMDTTAFVNGRIPKSVKPDLESMARFEYKGKAHLLLLGSGSSAARAVGFVVQADDPKQVRSINLSRFYTFLRQVLARNGVQQLNIEGLALDAAHVYLLQRSFGAEGNILFRFRRDAFLSFLLEGAAMPVAAVFHFALPALGPYQAGFSGAYILGDKLFFTASIEGTTDAVADGEVFGSFAGYISLSDLKGNKVDPAPVPVVQLRLPDGKLYGGKAESLVVRPADTVGSYSVIIVSDDDKGNSELLEVLVKEAGQH